MSDISGGTTPSRNAQAFASTRLGRQQTSDPSRPNADAEIEDHRKNVDVRITTDQSNALYTIYRAYLIHEDDLVHQRTTWSITIQGFIIAALGFAFQNRMDVSPVASPGTVSFAGHGYATLIFVFAFLGFGVSFISLFSVRAAQIAIRGLSGSWDNWRRRYPHCPDYPPLTGGGKSWATRFGHALPILLQGFFAFFWSTIIALQLSFQAGLIEPPSWGINW